MSLSSYRNIFLGGILIKRFFNILPCNRIAVFFLVLFCSFFLGHTSASAAQETDKSTHGTTTMVTLPSSRTLRLNYREYSLVKGKSVQLHLLNPPKSYTVTYASSNSKVATVSTKGKVTGKQKGTAKITATIKVNNKTYRVLTCSVEVGPAAISVVVHRAKITLSVGSKRHLSISIKPSNTMETPTYSSSNKSVATINSSGLITAKSVGETIITAKIANGKSAKCRVVVTAKSATTDLTTPTVTKEPVARVSSAASTTKNKKKQR